jgi:hypothetical protein
MESPTRRAAAELAQRNPRIHADKAGRLRDSERLVPVDNDGCGLTGTQSGRNRRLAGSRRPALCAGVPGRDGSR